MVTFILPYGHQKMKPRAAKASAARMLGANTSTTANAHKHIRGNTESTHKIRGPVKSINSVL